MWCEAGAYHRRGVAEHVLGGRGGDDDHVDVLAPEPRALKGTLCRLNCEIADRLGAVKHVTSLDTGPARDPILRAHSSARARRGAGTRGGHLCGVDDTFHALVRDPDIGCGHPNPNGLAFEYTPANLGHLLDRCLGVCSRKALRQPHASHRGGKVWGRLLILGEASWGRAPRTAVVNPPPATEQRRDEILPAEAALTAGTWRRAGAERCMGTIEGLKPMQTWWGVGGGREAKFASGREATRHNAWQCRTLGAKSDIFSLMLARC